MVWSMVLNILLKRAYSRSCTVSSLFRSVFVIILVNCLYGTGNGLVGLLFLISSLFPFLWFTMTSVFVNISGSLFIFPLVMSMFFYWPVWIIQLSCRLSQPFCYFSYFSLSPPLHSREFLEFFAGSLNSLVVSETLFRSSQNFVVNYIICCSNIIIR